MRDPRWLLEYQRNDFSQSGEDGVIEKILDTLTVSDRWCVEFGAWDGVHLTNTRSLILNRNFSAILIEADSAKFGELTNNYAELSDRVFPLNRYVGFNDDDNLDQILARTPIPLDFDLLSIDIDGNDYHVWGRVEKYRPKVVVIEFNPTIPTEVHFVQPADPKLSHGSSLLALTELGNAKGYELVCVLPFNAVFVDRPYFELFEIASNTPHVLRADMSCVTYLFSGYDGELFLRGCQSLPWHELPLRAEKLQPLPRYLRQYPDKYNRWQQLAMRWWLRFQRLFN